MTPKEAVKKLQDCGLTQSEIVSRLAEKKIVTTAATISRIGTGAHKNPGYELGKALVALCRKIAPADDSDQSAAA